MFLLSLTKRSCLQKSRVAGDLTHDAYVIQSYYRFTIFETNKYYSTYIFSRPKPWIFCLDILIFLSIKWKLILVYTSKGKGPYKRNQIIYIWRYHTCPMVLKKCCICIIGKYKHLLESSHPDRHSCLNLGVVSTLPLFSMVFLFGLGAVIMCVFPCQHDDVIKWKYYPRYWPFVRGIIRSVTRSFDIFFDLRLNQQLSKQWRCWRFETPSRSLWRNCNVSFPAKNRYTTYTEGCCNIRYPSEIYLKLNLHEISYIHFIHFCCLIILNLAHITVVSLCVTKEKK